MSFYTWENIPKNQIDSETIEQAIARMILAHVNDESAHLGVGQSLQSHKASAIIDHATKSVLFDNLSAQELIYSTSFENQDAFSVFGSPIFDWPGFLLNPGSLGYSNRHSVSISFENAGISLDFTKDFIIQFSCMIENLTGGSFRFQSALDYGSNLNRNIGLLIEDDLAKFFFSAPDGTNTVWLSWLDFEILKFYVIRIKYIASEQKAYFYVNNDLLGSLDLPSLPASDWFSFSFTSFQSVLNTANASISAFSVQLSP